MSFNFLLDLPPQGADGPAVQHPVLAEHSYCKSWRLIPALQKCQPRRTALFDVPDSRVAAVDCGEPADVDVVSVPAAEAAKPKCIVDRAEWRGEHCMLHRLQLIGVVECPEPDQWEDQVSRAGWTMQHNRLFDSIVQMLTTDVLASSVTQSLSHWDVHRCLQVKRLARSLRKLLGLYQWDRAFLLRAHTALIHHLPLRLLASYLDGLVALNRRHPALVQQTLLSGATERLAAGSTGRANITGQVRELVVGATEPDWLERRLSRAEVQAVQPALAPSDLPAQQPLPKLGLVLLSSLPASCSRVQSLAAVLGRLGRVQIVDGRATAGCNVSEYCRQVLGKFRTQLNHPELDRVLAVCLGPSACLAGTYLLCTFQRRNQLPDCLAGCVLIGPPSRDIFGRRGFPEDHLLHHSLPSLLLLGTETGFACPDELDWLRQRWPAKSRLVLFPGCDHYLRAGHRWLRALRLCQAGVDARAAAEVADFIRRDIFDIGGQEADERASEVGSEDTADAVPSPASGIGVVQAPTFPTMPVPPLSLQLQLPTAASSSTSSPAPATPTSAFGSAGVGKKRKQRLQDRLPSKLVAFQHGRAPLDSANSAPSTASTSGYRFDTVSAAATAVEQPTAPLDDKETASAINSILG